MRGTVFAVSAGVIALAGCATTGTNGVVPIGPDLYLIGGLGGLTDFSGSAVEVRMFHQAQAFCAAKGLVMKPVASKSKDAAPYKYASAEVQFSCVKPNAAQSASTQ